MLIDLFVYTAARALDTIRNEESLLMALRYCRYFKDVTTTTATWLLLRTAVYRYTVPGAPLFPPRSVRAEARAVHDYLFPLGSIFVQRSVYYAFRLLHPIQSLQSIVHWLQVYFLRVVATVLVVMYKSLLYITRCCSSRASRASAAEENFLM
mmetsp:Transcript_19228/g.47201  ORF Transcript_19228/g.47201 Transcript_19228/m.47201 type:complete len:152 (-) Transcript_19228:68-523(-)